MLVFILKLRACNLNKDENRSQVTTAKHKFHPEPESGRGKYMEAASVLHTSSKRIYTKPKLALQPS